MTETLDATRSDHGDRRSSTSVPTDLAVSAVSLRANDPRALAGFYAAALGLIARDGEAGDVLLGPGPDAAPLLTLRPLPAPHPRAPRTAGLFHTAFLMPDRASLAHWLRHAIETNVPLEGASDHNVSEAVYLTDPEGNGIEVYADRPRAVWTDAAGDLHMPSEALDAADLLAAAPPGPWRGLPAGTRLGHVHLKVGTLSAAEAFWSGTVGLALMTRYPGAAFFGAGGYHHQIAANVWQSRGAGPTDPNTPGLAGIALRVPDRAALDGIAARADAAGMELRREGDAVVLRDPWGTEVRLEV